MWKEATRVECTGLNLNKWVAKLLRCGYVIRDVEWRDECTLRMTIGVNAAKLFALFENSCYNKTIKMHILSQSGKTIWWHRLLARCGLAIGGVACLLFLFWYASGVHALSVELNGECSFTEEEIVSVLESRGIRGGMRKRGLILEEINEILTSAFDSVSFATAKLEGVLLRVEVYAKDTTPVVPQDKENIYALHSGVVTGVIVYSGTAAVKVGDTVEKGQLLIEGRLYAPDGSFVSVPADGKIYGVHTAEHVKKFDSVVVTPYRTGNIQTLYRYEAFGLSFPNRGFDCSFASYEVEEQVTYLFPNTFLPFRRRLLTLYELAYEEIEEDFEKVKKVLLEEAEREALEQYGALGEIQEKQIEVIDTVTGKDIVVRMTIRVELTGRQEREEQSGGEEI